MFRFLLAGKSRRVAALCIESGLLLLAAWHVLITISFWKANQFFTHDVGHIDYLLYHTWHGRFFWSIVCDCPHFAKHFTPTLVLLVPFHALFRHVLFVPIAEVLAAMSGAWAVAWMFDGFALRGSIRNASLRSLSPLGLAAGWLYACNPYVGSILLSNHFESFAMALFIWALAALANGRYRLFVLFALLSLGVKEDMSLYWASFGIWWIFFGWGKRELYLPIIEFAPYRRRALPGLALTLFCVVWAMIALGVIHHTARVWNQPLAEYGPRYQWMGSSLREAAKNILSHKMILIMTPVQMALHLIRPVLLLPILTPATLLLLMPGAYVMGWSMNEAQYSLLYYYSYPFIPFLFLGVCLAMTRLLRWSESGHVPERQIFRLIMVSVPLIAGIIMLTLPTRVDGKRRVPVPSGSRQASIRQALRHEIPPEASVVAQYDLLCQVPYRADIYPLSEKNLDRAQYWVLDLKGFIGDVDGKTYKRILDKASDLVARKNAEIVIMQDGLFILHVPKPPVTRGLP